MAEFAYKNAKNSSTGYTLFELNCGYHPRVSYEQVVDLRSKSKTADELAGELRELTTVCKENLHHAQDLQIRAHDKHSPSLWVTVYSVLRTARRTAYWTQEVWLSDVERQIQPHRYQIWIGDLRSRPVTCLS